ncbi:MAG: hypothetical protein U0S36_00700 [Candidatus Nanopelagicales bacterium]
MSTAREPSALRRAVLAITLLDQGDLADLEVVEGGVQRTGRTPSPVIGWDELLLAGGDPHDDEGEPVRRRRVARWLRIRLLLHDLVDGPHVPNRDAAATAVASRVRPRGLPRDHALHPGPGWTRRTILGGALDLGLALRGVDDDGRADPDAVGVLPAGMLEAAGIDAHAGADRAERYLQDMADLGAQRFRLDSSAVLRPLGDADVLTLLASRTYRVALLDGEGMRSAAVPVRTRGWLDLGRLDPAFAVTAAEITDPDERGFPRPVLVTRDEVTLVKAGGAAIAQSLADPAPPERGTAVERIF